MPKKNKPRAFSKESTEIRKAKEEKIKKSIGTMWGSLNTAQKVGMSPVGWPVTDLVGLAGDVQMYNEDPEMRSAGNYAMSGIGLLPFVPSVIGKIKQTKGVQQMNLFGDPDYVPTLAQKKRRKAKTPTEKSSDHVPKYVSDVLDDRLQKKWDSPFQHSIFDEHKYLQGFHIDDPLYFGFRGESVYSRHVKTTDLSGQTYRHLSTSTDPEQATYWAKGQPESMDASHTFTLSPTAFKVRLTSAQNPLPDPKPHRMYSDTTTSQPRVMNLRLDKEKIKTEEIFNPFLNRKDFNLTKQFLLDKNNKKMKKNIIISGILGETQTHTTLDKLNPKKYNDLILGPSNWRIIEEPKFQSFLKERGYKAFTMTEDSTLNVGIFNEYTAGPNSVLLPYDPIYKVAKQAYPGKL